MCVCVCVAVCGCVCVCVWLCEARRIPFMHQVGARGGEAIAKQVRLVLGNLEGVPDEALPRCNCCTTGNEDLIAYYIEA